MASKTKKIYCGVYLHIASGKYISAHYGDISTCWNIFNDVHCTHEYSIGFNTKWQAIEYLDYLAKNIL